MNTIKHKTIILFSVAILTVAVIVLSGCSAAGTRTGSHHEKRVLSTH